MVDVPAGSRDFWKHPALNGVDCGQMALRWAEGKKMGPEFYRVEEAKTGDILMFRGEEKAIFSIFITRDRVACAIEMRSCRGGRAYRPLLTRISGIYAEGLTFTGGIHIG